MRDNILFSILVPVYNVEEYVNHCIESVLHQTYSNFELVLVDDGSTDNSGNICDKYISIDDKVKVFHKQNQGLIHTRRFAIDKARGDYFIFLDSDDSLNSNALETIYNKIIKYDCDCVIYNWQRVSDGKILTSKGWNVIREECCVEDKQELYRIILSDSVYNSLCRKAVKATLFDGTQYDKFFEIKYGEDLLQSLEILKNCTKTVFIPDILYNYTVNPNSMMNTITYDTFKIDFTVQLEVLKFIKEENVFTYSTYDDFRMSCLRMVMHKVMIIARFKVDLRAKKKLFTDIKKNKYYQEITNSGIVDKCKLGKMRVVYFCFEHNRYYSLVTLGKIFK